MDTMIFSMDDEITNKDDGMLYRITGISGDCYRIEQVNPRMSCTMPVPVTKFVSQNFLIDCVCAKLGA
jgi:hypothetical protein